jgi:hypothetical protein
MDEQTRAGFSDDKDSLITICLGELKSTADESRVAARTRMRGSTERPEP